MMIETEKKIGKKEFLEEIKELCSELPFFSSTEVSNGLKIDLHPHTGLRIYLTIDPESEKAQIYFYLRTNSSIYDGDRTDLHDIITVSFAVFLRTYSISLSCALFDIPHPAIDNEGEIYARYIIPVQVSKELQNNYFISKGLGQIKSLFTSISVFEHFFWNTVGCPCDECFERERPKYRFRLNLPKVFEKRVESALGISNCYNTASRSLPKWNYYKDFDNLISVINSKGLANLFSYFASQLDISQTLPGETGNLIIGSSIRNFIPFKELEFANGVLQKIEGKRSNNSIKFIPLENVLVAIGKETILFFELLCGIDEFKEEKERVRNRHIRENKLLFSSQLFIWTEKVDASEFENLIKDLLNREPGISWVRKIGKTTESDQGRDLIAEWHLPPIIGGDTLSEESSPYSIKRIIIQCKAYKKTVNKSDIRDIRDTIDNFDSDGMLIVVLGNLTSQLVNHLDKIRKDGNYWIDWWGRDEIEDRLRIHDDLIQKYHSIVTLACEDQDKI